MRLKIFLYHKYMDKKHLGIMGCAFHKLKPKQQYYDQFLPWQELWRIAQFRFELEKPLDYDKEGKCFFIVKFLGTYSDMRFRINGEHVLEGKWNKFVVSSIDIITWDNSETVLAVF